MKIEHTTLPLSQLLTNTGQLEGVPANPRQWTKEEVQRLARSLKETPELLDARGIIVAPYLDKYVILGGNLRADALRELKATEAPCIIFRDLTPAKMREIVIKDNGSFGEWDFDALANQWDDLPLKEWGVEMPADWGQGAQSEAAGSGTAQEDDFDEDTDEIHVLCAKGDIWQLGEHRLMCGDSVQLADVQKLMGGVLSKMTFTDPPYGVAIGDKNKMLNSVQKAGCCCTNIENDTMAVPELYEVLRQAMSNVRECSASDATYYVCAPPGGDFGLMMMMMRDAGLNVRHQIVWKKNSPTFSLGRLDYDYQHEAIMYTWTKSHHNTRRGPFRTSVWDVDKPRKCDLHPTMKPVALVEAAMLDGSVEGDIVLDPFGGSGTTLIVSEQLGRKCRIMEIDPHYCDVIIARWEKLTGKQAVKLTA